MDKRVKETPGTHDGRLGLEGIPPQATTDEPAAGSGGGGKGSCAVGVFSITGRQHEHGERSWTIRLNVYVLRMEIIKHTLWRWGSWIQKLVIQEQTVAHTTINLLLPHPVFMEIVFRGLRPTNRSKGHVGTTGSHVRKNEFGPKIYVQELEPSTSF